MKADHHNGLRFQCTLKFYFPLGSYWVVSPHFCSHFSPQIGFVARPSPSDQMKPRFKTPIPSWFWYDHTQRNWSYISSFSSFPEFFLLGLWFAASGNGHVCQSLKLILWLSGRWRQTSCFHECVYVYAYMCVFIHVYACIWVCMSVFVCICMLHLTLCHSKKRGSTAWRIFF